MKFIKPSSQPATKEDLWLLQKTVLVSSIASSLVLIQAMHDTNYPPEKSNEFIEQMYRVITGLMDNFEIDDED